MATLPHVKLTAAGTLGATPPGNEIWSCGLKVIISASVGSTPLAPTEADLVALITPAQSAWAAYFNTANLLYTSAGLKTLTAAAVRADGTRDPAIDSVVFGYGAGVFGHAAPVSTAPVYQVSVVNTLRGATYTRGLASHGRFYPPLPNLFVGGAPGLVDGLMPLTSASAFANAAVTLIHAINVAVVPSGVAYVANVSEGAGTPRFQKVTSVQVDTRPDIQRRRGSSLDGAPLSEVAVP